MRKISTIGHTVIAVFLGGCAGSPVRIGMMDPEDLVQVESVDLCFAYSFTDDHDAKIKPELERREVFSTDEWAAIEQHRIFIGMSELAFRCSWATPGLLDLDSIYVSEEGSDVRQSDCASFRQRQCFDFDGLISTTASNALM